LPVRTFSASTTGLLDRGRAHSRLKVAAPPPAELPDAYACGRNGCDLFIFLHYPQRPALPALVCLAAAGGLHDPRFCAQRCPTIWTHFLSLSWECSCSALPNESGPLCSPHGRSMDVLVSFCESPPAAERPGPDPHATSPPPGGACVAPGPQRLQPLHGPLAIAVMGDP